jgi:lathosterol oxidase
MLLLEFVGLFLFILVPGYLLPAGYLYYWYYVQPVKVEKIQERGPMPGQVRREIKLSLLSILIFALMATGLFELYKAGMTSIYLRWGDYPLYYLPLSFLLCLVIHDTYFYWTHRFMHWQPVFKYIHVGHHRSVSPTPWAIFSFQPLEAMIQFCGIMMIVIFVPLHPLMLLAFLAYDTLVNTAGHTGYELVPKFISQSPPFKVFNTVTHHDSHHTNMRVNFGVFFNLWDRCMGTFQDDAAPDPVVEVAQQCAVSKRAAKWEGKKSVPRSEKLQPQPRYQFR